MLTTIKKTLKKNAVLLGLATTAMLISVDASAGTTAATSSDMAFKDIYEAIKDWTTGWFGRTIALALILVGMAMGVVKQSVMAAVPGMAAGLILSVAPGVVENILGAVV